MQKDMAESGRGGPERVLRVEERSKKFILGGVERGVDGEMHPGVVRLNLSIC